MGWIVLCTLHTKHSPSKPGKTQDLFMYKRRGDNMPSMDRTWDTGRIVE